MQVTWIVGHFWAFASPSGTVTARQAAPPAEPRPLLEPRAEQCADPLTRRELEILRLLAEGGHSNGEMARLLWVTEQTIKFHLANVFRKLEVSNRTQAVTVARARGLLAEEAAA